MKWNEEDEEWWVPSRKFSHFNGGNKAGISTELTLTPKMKGGQE